MVLNKILSKVISKIKNEEWDIDTSIPISYILSLFFHKIIALCRGIIFFGKLSFIGSQSHVKARKMMHIKKGLSIDRNCYIDALSIYGIDLGHNVSIGKNTTIECTGSMRLIGKGLKVGNNVGLGTHGFYGCAGGIEIGDDTIFGNYVSLHSENHNYDKKEIPIRLQGVNRKGIKIGNNCWIGAKVTILDGVVIEDGCIIAACALLTEGIYKTNSIYGGVPAKLLKSRF